MAETALLPPAAVEGAKLNPPVVVPVAVDAGLVPKENPPPVDGRAADAVGAGATDVVPPKLNPPDPIEAAGAVAAASPKPQPPVPMALDAGSEVSKGFFGAALAIGGNAADATEALINILKTREGGSGIKMK